jgi:hypothetical protein
MRSVLGYAYILVPFFCKYQIGFGFTYGTITFILFDAFWNKPEYNIYSGYINT